MKNSLIIIAVLLLFFGCIGEWRVIAEPHEPEPVEMKEGKPKDMSLYVSQEYDYDYENYNYEAEMTLTDFWGNEVSADGNVEFVIKDDYDKILYSSNFHVDKDNFTEEEDYFYGTTLKYTWTIQREDILESDEYYGTAEATFTTTDGDSITGENYYITLPQPTAEDYEIEYLESAKEIGKTVKLNDNLEITVLRAGVYEYDSWLGNYRVDFSIKNTGSSVTYVEVDGGALLIGGKQYDGDVIEYYNGGDLYPAAEYDESLVFDGVPENISGTAKMYLKVYKDENHYYDDKPELYSVEFEIR